MGPSSNAFIWSSSRLESPSYTQYVRDGSSALLLCKVFNINFANSMKDFSPKDCQRCKDDVGFGSLM